MGPEGGWRDPGEAAWLLLVLLCVCRCAFLVYICGFLCLWVGLGTCLFRHVCACTPTMSACGSIEKDHAGGCKIRAGERAPPRRTLQAWRLSLPALQAG